MLVDIVIAAMARLPALAHEPSRNFTSPRETPRRGIGLSAAPFTKRAGLQLSSPANLPRAAGGRKSAGLKNPRSFPFPGLRDIKTHV
jgi:hypothetical protein